MNEVAPGVYIRSVAERRRDVIEACCGLEWDEAVEKMLEFEELLGLAPEEPIQ